MAEWNEKDASTWRPPRPQGIGEDCLFLSLIILLSLILYVGGLGFYDDDWTILREFDQSTDQSPFGLISYAFDVPQPAVKLRPVDVVYYGALYWMFGVHPLGYHVANALVLMAGILVFYSLLRELNLNRLLALTVPMVYGLLPHYSTNRFWFAAFAGNLSMALYFLSLYADLRMVKAQPTIIWRWKFLSVLSLLGSTLAYEHFIPLFFLNPLVVLYYQRQRERTGSPGALGRRGLAALLGANLIVLMLVVAFKMQVLSRLGRVPGPNIADRVQYLIEGAVYVNLRRYGTGLPGLIWRILHDYPSVKIAGTAGILGLAAFGYFYFVARVSEVDVPKWSVMFKLIGFGFLVSGLGYAIFLTAGKYGFSVSGPGNRIAIAAAVGVAFAFVGGLGWISSLPHSRRLQRICFCALIALLCSGTFLITNTIASFWTAAYRQQQLILADIHEYLPNLPPNSTLILDGVCPYNGPAVVFHSQWDLKAALTIRYHYNNIQAAVVTPNLKVNEDGLSTFMYGDEQHFPYRQLFVYLFGRKVTFQLQNAEAARQYFAEFNPDFATGCPKGNEGDGVLIF